VRLFLKIWVFVFLSLTAGQNFAQWILPPYKAKFEPLNNDYKDYHTEADLTGDGKLDAILRTLSDPRTIQSLLFYNNNKLIDAYNTDTKNDEFGMDYILHKPERDYYLTLLNSKNRVSLLSFYIQNNKLILKDIYSYRTFRDIPRDEAKFIYLKKDNILIVAFNTVYPHKHDFRRIVAFNTNTFNILWEKYTADFIFSFFYSSIRPNSIYFTTIAYTNGLFFSNNVFYSYDGDKFVIDTVFDNSKRKISSIPDSTASDYSTDTRCFIARMDIKSGKILWRKKLGGRFFRAIIQKEYVDSNQNMILYDRSRHLNHLLKFNISNETLRKLNFPKSKFYLFATLPVLKFWNKHLIFFNKNTLYFYNINGNKPKFVKKLDISLPDILRLVSTKKFLIPLHLHQVSFINTNLEEYALGEIPANINQFSFRYSDLLNSVIIPSTNLPATIVKFEELPFLRRINSEKSYYIILALIIILAFLLSFWFVTMFVSRKRLEKKNNELELATAQLIHSEKLALLGRISASFAHQLNSPLGAIINSAERLERKIEDENLSLIKRSADYSKRLVQKFLTTSRLGKTKEKQCASFEKVWDNWFELFRDEALRREIKINLDFNHNNNSLLIRQSELFEIFTNILFNARDSILQANKKEKKINILTEEVKDNFIFIVEDTGIGFSHEALKNAFEPFFTTKKTNEGTGLGLWIVKKLVNSNKGKIKIKNNRNGATVIIKLKFCKTLEGEGEEIQNLNS
jgi:signal transduction histidine kinase/outer membrane protein assembly factor BamB